MMLHSNRLRIFLLASALSGIAATASPVAQAATFVIVNNDSAGEGFNDPTPAAPVGGNTGTTIGAQRLIAFQHAADIWAARLSSPVTIRVRGQWDPLSCSAGGGVLGSAGPITVHRDFSGAPVAGTWYPQALANALNGSDLDGSKDDINATFNGNWGTAGCGTASGWYLGLDGNSPVNLIDFVTVLLHELGHGLGFSTFVNLGSGAKFGGFNDAYMLNLENHGASPSDYPSMSDAQRVAASQDTGNLHWVGSNVRAASGVLSAGTVGKHVRMYAPSPQQGGSSVSHWDTVLTPNQLMEPSYTAPLHTPVLELPLFKDIGWTVLDATAPHDFNSDGMSDILLHRDNGKVALWEMDSNTITNDINVGMLGTNWQIAGVGDVNGDGKADIIWRNTGSGKVRVWQMNGGTINADDTVGKLGTNWQIAGIGDVDGDGKADIIWRHANTGKVRVWQLNGSAVKSKDNVGNLGTNWQVAGIGDVDGDGKADIVWRHANNGNVRVWQMNGSAIKSDDNLGGLNGSWQISAVGDVDGDGKADIIWRRTNGKIKVWKLNGSAIDDDINVGGASVAWQIISTGDFDGDGKADLLLRHTGGKVAIWTIDGGAIADKLNVKKVSSSWSLIP